MHKKARIKPSLISAEHLSEKQQEVLQHLLDGKHVAETAQLTGYAIPYLCLFCPYAIGKELGGGLVVLAFQYGGSCSGGLPIEGAWKSFQVDGFSRLEKMPMFGALAMTSPRQVST